MATSTPNLNLILPDYSDKADISVLNDNFQKIDEYCANGGVSNEDLQNALNAANAWANATASAESVSADNEADVNLTEGDNSKNLHFSIPRGQPGVLISETEPTDPNVKVWIKPDGEPNELEQLKSDVSSLKDHKADAIMDTSARAASHELHAQDGPLAVTLYGKTTETGTGDKSPDNPYTISGVDAAQVCAGGKNLFDISKIDAKYITDNKTITASTPGYHCDLYAGGVGSGVKVPLDVLDRLPYVTAGQYVLTYDIVTDDSKSLLLRMVGEDGAVSTPASSGNFDGTGAIYTIDHPTRITIRRSGNVTATISNLMLTPGTEVVPYEPYNANVITPALLPDGAPLMGNGTVDDTIENDVLSGCDKKVTLNGTEEIFAATSTTDIKRYQVAYVLENAVPATTWNVGNGCSSHLISTSYSWDALTAGKYAVMSAASIILAFKATEVPNVAAFRAWLAEKNPTFFYRSTAYTPDKDLRACKVTRKWKQIESYAGGTVPSGYVSSTGGLDTGAQVVYPLATPEVYMTDPLDLRKPTGIMPVTVTGSDETAVAYPCDTKTYIDRKFDALAAALIGG